MSKNNEQDTKLANAAIDKNEQFSSEELASTGKVLSPGQLALRNFRKNKLAMVGAFVFAMIILLSAIAPWITPTYGAKTDLNNHTLPPSSTVTFEAIKGDPTSVVTESRILGTDEVGRDVWTRIVFGGRNTLVVAILASLLSTFIAVVVGGVSGYYGGMTDTLMMRFTEIVMTFPYLPTMLVVSFILRQRELVSKDKQIYLIAIIIGLLSWGTLARMIRGQILSLREQEFMEAATALGISDIAKVFKHLLPNTLGFIMVSMTLSFAGAILSEVSLSFLGLGVSFDQPSWGNIMQYARQSHHLKLHPWMWLPCSIIVILSVVSINLLGEGLRDAFDPKSNR